MKKIDNSECLSDFGKYISDARTRKNLTQSEVAKALGIRQGYYSMIECGKRNVDLIMAMNICNILGVDLKPFIEEHM